MSIRELLNLPDHVRRGDFHFALGAGFDADATTRSYELTESLLSAFTTAVDVVAEALEPRRSAGFFVVGDFGTGRSHFLGMLAVLFGQRDVETFLHEPLAKLLDRAGLEQRKLLPLPVSLAGKPSLEAAVLGGYVSQLRRRHPEARAPALFSDHEIFDRAQSERHAVGDGRFFERLNESRVANNWNAAAFEEAISSGKASVRERLFASLLDTIYPDFADADAPWLPLDEGLAAMCRHAQRLGYEAVVPLVDGLRTWLTRLGHIDTALAEAAKLAHLADHSGTHRAIPMVSFVSRANPLSDVVGYAAVGRDRRALEAAIQRAGRTFNELAIDAQMADVVQRCVTRPRSGDASAALEAACAEARVRCGDAWDTLRSGWPEADFLKVYPLSPALVEGVVALTACFDGSRSASHLLAQLLVEHLDRVEPGEVVPVGEVFDVLIGGETSNDPVMAHRFETAAFLYAHEFLPRIRAGHGTQDAARCQRLRPEHRVELGCATCPEKACRDDNRAVKTLLLAALVPEASPFVGLTAQRLAQLNATAMDSAHTPVLVDRLRAWAKDLGQLRIGNGENPSVRVRLEGIALDAIIARGREHDTADGRRQTLQRILFEALELPTSRGAVVEKHVRWRGTDRKGCVRFGNVRQMPDSALGGRSDDQWFVVVDYPFDDPGFTPIEDVERLELFRDENVGARNPTMVWLPTFFSGEAQNELGMLTVIDHILNTDHHGALLSHLDADARARARLDLGQRRMELDATIGRSVARAYGVAPDGAAGDLDAEHPVSEHIISLRTGLEAPTLASVSSLRDGLHLLARRILDHRYPDHPNFAASVTAPRLERVRGIVEHLLDSDQGRLPVGAEDHVLVEQIAAPLGLIAVDEGAVVLNAQRLLGIEQQRARAAVDAPTVAQVRRYLDPEWRLGLAREASDLLVWCYALWSGRAPVRQGEPYPRPPLGTLQDDVELFRPNLPDEADWERAIALADAVFDVSVPHRLTALSLEAFDERVGTLAERLATALDVPSVLELRLHRWAPGHEEAPRLASARAAAALVAAVSVTDPVERVRALASFDSDVPVKALAATLTATPTVLAKLLNASLWANFERVAELEDSAAHGEQARTLCQRLRDVVTASESVTPLGPELDALTRAAVDLLRQPTAAPAVDGWGAPSSVSFRVEESSTERALRAASERLAAALGSDPGEVLLEVTISVRRREEH